MEKIRLMLISMLLLCTGIAWSQTRTVSGRVIDENGNGLPFATVTIKGTTIALSTDSEGVFSISVTGNVQLEISSTGYTSTVITPKSGDNVVVLKNTSTLIDEVVVIGYGTRTVKRMSSSVSKLDGEAVRNLPVASVIQGLQGQIPGVNITASSGRPGSPVGINIRGRTSINAGNAPLYVVDGVILTNNNTNLPTTLTAGQGLDPLASLNPEDIESYEVLKDAAAAAIYGSRGSNGVVLITTKKGSKNKQSRINFSTYYGLQELTKRPEVLGASEYRILYDSARKSLNLAPLFTADQINNPENNINWIDQVLRDKPTIKNYQVSIQSGNDKKTQFFTSLGYFKQEGPLSKGDFSRYNARLNIEHTVNDMIKVGTNIGLARTLRNETPVDNSIYSPFPRANVARPDQPIYNPDGKYAINDFNNPVQMFEVFNQLLINNVINSTYGELKILPGLTFRSSVGIDYTALNQRVYNPKTSLSGVSSNGSGNSGNVTTQNYILTQNLSYSKSFIDDKLQLDANAVYEYQNNEQDNMRVDGSDFPSDLTNYVGSAAKITGGTASWTSFKMTSIIGRANLSWRNRYLLSASIRRDGSSKIPKQGRFGVFPAVSAGWNIAEEDFLKGRSVSTLKIRASYGLTGNQDGIGNFASRRLFGTGFNYADQPGIALTTLGSPNLKWETTKQFDVGIDVGLLKDRITFTADYYKKVTDDLLLNRPINPISGFNTILENIGSIEGDGWDFGINSTNITNKDLIWTTSINISTYKNKVTKLYDDQPINGTFVTRHAVGQPLGSFFLIKSLGVDPATGDMMYEDIDDNKQIDANDRQFLGNPLPKVQGGITNTVRYKGIDFSLFFQYALGQEVYNLNAQGLGGYESLGANVTNATNSPANIFKEVFDNRWTPTNTDAKYPRIVGGPRGNYNTQNSSRYLQDASYGRVKNITIGYTLPADIISKVRMSSLRIYISSQNPITFTKYRGYDPEVTSDLTVNNLGVDQTSVPPMKTLLFGLQVQF